MGASQTLRSAKAGARSVARRVVNRWDQPEVRGARQLIKQLRRDPPDVLYLGDSTTVFTAAYDSDSRRFGQMLADELKGDASVHVIAGGGYHPELHLEYLEFVDAYRARPLVLHSLCIRVRQAPWVEHPIYGHKEAMRALRTVDPTGSLWRVRRGHRPPGPEEWVRHGQIAHPTLIGEKVIDDYVNPLTADNGFDEEERTRLRYAYHHGGTLVSEAPELEAVTRLGARLQALGCRVVAFHNPVCIEKGVELLGPEFASRMAANRYVLEAAYRCGAPDGVEVLQTGDMFSPDEFVDPADGTEHLNERGRTRLTQLVAVAIRQALARD